MSFSAVLGAVRSGARDTDTLDDLARASVAEGEEEAALEILVPAAERSGAPLIWQWVALLQRSLDDHEAALRSFSKAAAIAPGDARIAHGHARTALEAGLDSVDLFLRARSLAPTNGDILLGLAAARNAIGEGQQAAEELAALLDRAPAWTAGHEQLAQLLAILGCPERSTESLERALARFPGEESLWRSLFGVDLRREDYAALERDLSRARTAGIHADSLNHYQAIVAAERDQSTFPELLFGTPGQPAADLGLWQIRHLLRLGAVEHALPIIDRELRTARAAAVWPYASLAWRLAGDPRSAWLEGGCSHVRTFDLQARLPPLGLLAQKLRELHVAKAEYVDQSVRGGTQTDGPLLSRIDPLIRELRTAIVGAVEDYVRALPPVDHAHPLLSQRRDRRVRFAGSWSVRLRPGGRHANHVHPEGWISSALYVSLPDKAEGERTDAGWFTIGQPQEQLGIDVEPQRTIEPKPGRLVLFPSWMWHGTLPFAEGERLTVAFDVRPPV